jgi:hypothetical protein
MASLERGTPTASDGLRQPHAHILTSVREVGPDGFGAKVRAWDKRELVTSLRAEWADCCNQALELAGREERVSHLSLEARLQDALARGDFDRAAEVDRLPGVHLGPAAAAMEREGIATDLGDTLRAVAEENTARAAAYEAVREMAADVPEAPTRFLEMRAASADPISAFEAWGEWAMAALEQLRELALGTVERVQEMAISAWDNLVAAMSPLSDFALAERAAAEEHEAELEREMGEVLAEMGAPEPQHEHEDREQEHVAEIEPPELGDEDDWLERLLDEMDHENAWDRGHGIEHEM